MSETITEKKHRRIMDVLVGMIDRQANPIRSECLIDNYRPRYRESDMCYGTYRCPASDVGCFECRPIIRTQGGKLGLLLGERKVSAQTVYDNFAPSQTTLITNSTWNATATYTVTPAPYVVEDYRRLYDEMFRNGGWWRTFQSSPRSTRRR